MGDSVIVGVKGSLNHVWLSANELGIFKKCNVTASSSSDDLVIEEVRWGTSMYNDEFMRRFAKSSYEIFAALQKNTDQNLFINYSVQYRGTLAACSNEISTFLKFFDDIGDARLMHLTAQGNLIQTFELLWHLAELVFIQVSPSGYLALSLCSWFYLQSQEAANCAREFLEAANREQTSHVLLRDKLNNLKSFETNKHFWPTVLSLVLQAKCQEAAGLLVLHSNSNGRGLRSLRQLLASMPIASRAEKEGTWAEFGVQFSQAWNYWQAECEHRLSSGEFDHVGGDTTSVDYIRLIVNILSGRTSVWDDPRILEVTRGPRGWFFRFVSFVFYTDQLVTVDGLSSDLDRWLALTSKGNPEPGSNFDQSVDALITSIFRVDIFSFVRISNKSSLVEFFLLGYAESLASESSLLPIALGYLDHCKSGRALQSALILKHAVPVSTRATNWFISQAKVRGLHSTSEELAKLNCRRYLSLSLHSSENSSHTISRCVPTCIAVGWALLAHDYPIVSRLAEISLARDCGFTNKDISDGDRRIFPPASTEVAELAAIILGFCRGSSFSEPSSNSAKTTEISHLQLSPELAFLVRYAELQQCFNDGDCEGAVDRLIDLLLTSPGGSLIYNSNDQNSMTSSSGAGLRIPTCLKVRLLGEVRHLLGRKCLRRDQVEVLITALVELRSDLDMNLNNSSASNDMHSLLTTIHISLARELASTFFTTCSSIPLTPSLSPSSAVSATWH
ncbi:unnamed protein product [Heterobilharzia americana]|nr:unnamed protein product [Heterobilharzia americana]CAH8574801.1 unnamed protein product [Heterobilharzia americana]